MCGIAGVFSRKPLQTDLLNRISASIQHRGPDDEGFALCDRESEILSCKGDDSAPGLKLDHISNHSTFNKALAHRRLSILDTSIAGHQPMLDASKKNALVFNGEVYNYTELAKEFLDGNSLNSGSDTEVIFQLFLKKGIAAVEHFNGMWGLAFYNKNEDKLYLSRDRFGIKPLYYYHKNGLFAFASEIKALLKIPEIKAEVKTSDLAEYLSFGTLAKPHSNLFKNINELTPGCNLIYDCKNDELKIHTYYSIENQIGKTKKITESEAIEEFRTLFANSINEHLRSDVSVGTCLSGGLDSSAILAAVKHKDPASVFNSFTATFPGMAEDESHFAKKAAGNFSGVSMHFTTPSASDFLKNLNELIYHQDLPIGSTSVYAQYAVMNLAADSGIKVLLDGQGADEILGGYYNFAGQYLVELLQNARLLKFKNEFSALKENFNPAMPAAMGRAFYYKLPSSFQRAIRKKERLGMDFIHPDFQHVLNKINIPERGGKSFRELSINSLNFGLSELLRYEDRNSMRFSIESRVPFLDHRLVEFIISLPTDLKIKNGWTKYILRKSAEPNLPNEIVWRKDKLGFVTPQQQWKSEVMPTLIEEIHAMEFPEIMDKKHILNLTRKSLDKNVHLSEFWRMYSVLKWFECFKVQVV